MNSQVSSSTRNDSVAENRNDCRFSGLRQPAQDEPEVGDEAHVEHPVGLVDDEHLDLAGRPDVLLEIVDEPARGADQQVAALRAGPRAACCSRCPRRPRGCAARCGAPSSRGVGLDLHHQLARGRDDEHARRGHAAPRRSRGAQAAGEGGDQEGGRLAGAGLRLAGHVLALERERQRRLLDGGGGHEARRRGCPASTGSGRSREVNSSGLTARPPAWRLAAAAGAFLGASGRRSARQRCRPRRAG